MDFSNVATAVFTGIMVLFACLKWIEDHTAPDPIVECRIAPVDQNTGAPGDYAMRLLVRNRAEDTMNVTKATVKRPSGAQLHKRSSGGAPAWLPASQSIEANLDLSPFGWQDYMDSGLDGVGGTVRDEKGFIDFNLTLPQGWRGGNVEILLTIAFNSSVIRKRSFKVRRTIIPDK